VTVRRLSVAVPRALDCLLSRNVSTNVVAAVAAVAADAGLWIDAGRDRIRGRRSGDLSEDAAERADLPGSGSSEEGGRSSSAAATDRGRNCDLPDDDASASPSKKPDTLTEDY
jgi:plasmid stability protein